MDSGASEGKAVSGQLVAPTVLSIVTIRRRRVILVSNETLR